jgi:hypothetical protein
MGKKGTPTLLLIVENRVLIAVVQRRYRPEAVVHDRPLSGIPIACLRQDLADPKAAYHADTLAHPAFALLDELM